MLNMTHGPRIAGNNLPGNTRLMNFAMKRKATVARICAGFHRPQTAEEYNKNIIT